MTKAQDGGKVVSLTHRPPLPPGNTLVLISIRGWIVPRAMQASYGKAVPLQAWSGPEGSGKLRFPDFMTTAEDYGKVVSLTLRPPLPPGNTTGTHFC